MEQDYDKIFASNASSSQDWDDENYLKGWGFLGQTPPPYQLFDALFKRLDLKTKELRDEQENMDNKYLPLSGGTMAGLLSLFAGSTVPTADANDNSTKIVNSEWVQALIKKVVSELSENIEVEWSGETFTVPSLGITGLMAQNGYICFGKLFGGLILQWGVWNIINAAPASDVTIVFTVNFTANCFCVVSSVQNSADNQIGYWNITKTSANIKKGASDYQVRNGLYFAIGY